ncbi:sugar transferase [Flavobacteriaceae bacterium]|nr:sugar transferase [Flavobacteriaceae bacterium]
MYNLLKRIFDILASGIAILILSPLLIPIIIGLSLTGEGHVWYKQERLGYRNKPFLIWKFATMLKNSANMQGGYITVKKDPRLTPMGDFLRKSKINELPQLFNIFVGSMSIVGPRPVMKVSFEAYPNNIKKVIYDVKPGLTGLGSVIFRDEEELITDVRDKGGDIHDFYINKIYPHKGNLELWYQKNKSLILDFQIILLTAWVIFNSESKIYEKWFKDLPKRSF